MATSLSKHAIYITFWFILLHSNMIFFVSFIFLFFQDWLRIVNICYSVISRLSGSKVLHDSWDQVSYVIFQFQFVPDFVSCVFFPSSQDWWFATQSSPTYMHVLYVVEPIVSYDCRDVTRGVLGEEVRLVLRFRLISIGVNIGQGVCHPLDIQPRSIFILHSQIHAPVLGLVRLLINPGGLGWINSKCNLLWNNYKCDLLWNNNPCSIDLYNFETERTLMLF